MKIYKIVIVMLMLAALSVTVRAQGMPEGRPLHIGVLVAMEKEYNQLKDYFTSDRVTVRLCGIGKVNAAAGCTELIRDCKPDVVISFGCAGGNGEGVHLGDVVVSTETAYHDVYCGPNAAYGQIPGLPERYVTPQWLVHAACREQSVLPGLIVSGDWFVDTKEKMGGIIDRFPEVKAVDMESAAIAHVCYLHQVPFISVRIISDAPLKDEHASQYLNFWDAVTVTTFAVARTIVERITNSHIK